MAKAEKTKQTMNILRVKGIMAQGYGVNPKIVMRDKRLTPEAKCIYSYLASFAGGGNQAFPSRDIMLDELQMSVNRYYKHLKFLTEAEYIRIERSRNASGIYDKNIYIIVALPNPTPSELKQEIEPSEMSTDQKAQSTGRQKRSGRKRRHVKERASTLELRERRIWIKT